MLRRSLLYVPANRPDYFARAAECGADAIVLDLEDSVFAADKDDARRRVAGGASEVRQFGADVLLRVNPEMPTVRRDIRAGVEAQIDGLVVPKVESPTDVVAVVRELDRIESDLGSSCGATSLVALLESPAAIERAFEIANSSQRLVAMAAGVGDYRAAMGVAADSDIVRFAVMRTVNAARAAGIQPLGLLAGISQFRDLQRYEQLAIRSRDAGLDGSMCVHPSQVPVLNRVFSRREDVERAHQIIAAYQHHETEGSGVFTLDGMMVDRATVAWARNVIERGEVDAGSRQLPETDNQ